MTREKPENVWIGVQLPGGSRRFRAPGCGFCFCSGAVEKYGPPIKLYPPCSSPDPTHAGQWEDGMQAPGKLEPLPKGLPSNKPGIDFYKALRKAGYTQKTLGGDYT